MASARFVILYISYNGATEPIFHSQVLPYMRELVACGEEIVLLTFERPDGRVPKQLQDLRRVMEEAGIHWVSLTYHKWPPVLSTAYDILRGVIAAERALRRFPIGAVHARSYVPGVIAWLVTRWRHVKFLFDMRGMMADEYVDGGLLRRGGMLYRFIKRIEEYLLSAADEIVVLTENIREVLSYHVSGHQGSLGPITVIPCCVDVNHFRPVGARRNDQGKGIQLVYVGSVGTWYCLEEMAEFFKAWRANKPEAHWLILSQSDHGTIRTVLEAKGIPEDEVTIQAMPYETLPQSLAHGDVGIAFIVPTFSKRASCPTKLGEYLACGLPVVINAGIGDTQALVERHRVGVVVKDFSPLAYASAVEELDRLLQEPGMADKCRRVAEEELALPLGVASYLEVYSRLK